MKISNRDIVPNACKPHAKANGSEIWAKPSFRNLIALLILVVAGLPLTASANINVPAEARFSLQSGQGFDSIAFEGKESPFVADSTASTLNTGINKVSFEKTEVQHRLDVFSVLSGGLAGSYDWGEGSVSANMQGLTVSKSSKSTYHLLVKVESLLGQMTMNQTPVLTETAKAILRSNPNAFLSVYGDHYIRNVRVGGRFFAMIDIESAQDESREEIQAALNLTSTTTDFSAFVNSLKTQTASRYRLSITITYVGGYQNIPTLDKLDEFYRNFPGEVAKNPSNFDYEAFSLINHPEVQLLLAGAGTGLPYLQKKTAGDKLYAAIKATDLALEDLNFVKAISQGALYNALTGADRDLIARGADALAIRSDWLKARLEETVVLSQLPDLAQMPPLVPIPFEITKTQIPTGKLLLTAQRTGFGQRGEANWPAVMNGVRSEIYVRAGTLYAHAVTGYSWSSSSGDGPVLFMEFDTGEQFLAALPHADYTLLPCGGLSCSDNYAVGPKGPNDYFSFDGGPNVLAGGSRSGIFQADFTLKPIRVLSLMIAQVPPVIVTQPESQKTPMYDPALLRCDAYGTGNLTYQWRRNGVVLPGATNPTLFIPSVDSASAGVYSVEIKNEAGAAISKSATVSFVPVGTAPSISQQPVSQTVNQNATVSFSVSASGTEPLTYQWRKNGENITGATLASLSIASAQLTDAGDYSVVVSNALGSAPSAVATLIVKPVVVQQPHPADTNADYRIVISEMTGYAAAWKQGRTWSNPPNPIPIGYLTRAGALWKGGEKYRQDTTAGISAPLWWVNGTAGLKSPGAGSIRASAVSPSSAVRAVAGTQVTVSVSPGSTVGAYAVEESLPAGFNATGVSDSGTIDLGNRKVKWGPFFDNTARNLAYTLQPPSGFNGSVDLAGVASFDGEDSAIGGATRFTAGGPPSARSVALVAGQPIVTVNVAPPSGTSAYAVEEQLPAGFSGLNITQGGTFDAPSNKVKWGPFFDATARSFSYTLSAPAGYSGVVRIAGIGSFDGIDSATGGTSEYTFGGSANGGTMSLAIEIYIGLKLKGTEGETWRIEAAASPEGPRWEALGTVTLTKAEQVWVDPAPATHAHWFYRAVRQ